MKYLNFWYEHCVALIQQSSERIKLEDIRHTLLDQLTSSCPDCGDVVIDRQSFACYPESPTHVTYRARLEGTSETDSDSLISLIEEWVRGGASIIVTGVLMTVDSECSVAISSLSEGECQPPITDPTVVSTDSTTDEPTADTSATDSATMATTDSSTDSTDQSSSDNNTAIIGGVVAIVIVLIIAITVAITCIALVYLRNRRGDVSFKNVGK